MNLLLLVKQVSPLLCDRPTKKIYLHVNLEEAGRERLKWQTTLMRQTKT